MLLRISPELILLFFFGGGGKIGAGSERINVAVQEKSASNLPCQQLLARGGEGDAKQSNVPAIECASKQSNARTILAGG